MLVIVRMRLWRLKSDLKDGKFESREKGGRNKVIESERREKQSDRETKEGETK